MRRVHFGGLVTVVDGPCRGRLDKDGTVQHKTKSGLHVADTFYTKPRHTRDRAQTGFMKRVVTGGDTIWFQFGGGYADK